MESYLAELGVGRPILPNQLPDPFPEQLEVIISERVPIFSCTFGILEPEILERLKKTGIKTMGTATTVAEAVAVEQAGMDIVVTQGSEAGAHRGTFLGDFETSMIGSMALIPQVVDAISIPVIAAGGIMDGRGILAAFALGASGVQMGTAFLTCDEATIPEPYKRALETTPAEQTALTRIYSGRPARGIINQFMRDAAGREDSILPFPFQNNLTRPMRNAASVKGDIRCMSLWAGQAASLTRRIEAGRLVELLMEETFAAYRRLNYSS
jgi:nitronate monooxygenase